MEFHEGAGLRRWRWRARIRLILADLLAFDAGKLAWGLALRTIAGLMLPIFAAWLLDAPALNWVGVGAYLLAIGDSVDDGDRWQTMRLATGALNGGAALATGILSGSNLLVAMIGMAAWGLLTGFAGALGNTAAAMALPIAWGYLELGLPAPDHSLANALSKGGLFAAGGALVLALVTLLRLSGPYAPLRTRVAACYEALAQYLQSLEGGLSEGESAITPETRVRDSLIEARRLATLTRARQQGGSDLHRRLVMLIELADRMFSIAALHREIGPDGDGGADVPALPVEALHAIARALARRAEFESLRRMLPALEALAGTSWSDAIAAPAIERQIARALCHAARIVIGDEAPTDAETKIEPGGGLSALLAPLAGSFDPRSLVARHALRFAVVAALAVAVFWMFPRPFGYWVPLTVSVVMKPYAGMTLARTGQRIIGTFAGIALGMLLTPLLPGPLAQMLLVAVCFFWMMAVLPFNYSLAILFLSAGLIPFEQWLYPGLHQNLGLLRLAGTGIGAALAVIGGHLLWPDFERDSLPALLKACLSSFAAYADRVLESAEGRSSPELVAADRRRAGRDLGNLQATVQHALSEVGGDPAHMQRVIRIGVLLQRLLNAINGIMNLAPGLAAAKPDLDPIRRRFASSFGRLIALAERPDRGAPALAAAGALKPEQIQADPSLAFFEREIECIDAQVALLASILTASPCYAASS
jgi:uncharacterized membrane protein YccC